MKFFLFLLALLLTRRVEGIRQALVNPACSEPLTLYNVTMDSAAVCTPDCPCSFDISSLAVAPPLPNLWSPQPFLLSPMMITVNLSLGPSIFSFFSFTPQSRDSSPQAGCTSRLENEELDEVWQFNATFYGKSSVLHRAPIEFEKRWAEVGCYSNYWNQFQSVTNGPYVLFPGSSIVAQVSNDFYFLLGFLTTFKLVGNLTSVMKNAQGQLVYGQQNTDLFDFGIPITDSGGVYSFVDNQFSLTFGPNQYMQKPSLMVQGIRRIVYNERIGATVTNDELMVFPEPTLFRSSFIFGPESFTTLPLPDCKLWFSRLANSQCVLRPGQILQFIYPGVNEAFLNGFSMAKVFALEIQFRRSSYPEDNFFTEILAYENITNYDYHGAENSCPRFGCIQGSFEIPSDWNFPSGEQIIFSVVYHDFIVGEQFSLIAGGLQYSDIEQYQIAYTPNQMKMFWQEFPSPDKKFPVWAVILIIVCCVVFFSLLSYYLIRRRRLLKSSQAESNYLSLNEPLKV